jgi:hypothetical protein
LFFNPECGGSQEEGLDAEEGCGCEAVGGKGKGCRQEHHRGETSSEEDGWEGPSNNKSDLGQEDKYKYPVKAAPYYGELAVNMAWSLASLLLATFEARSNMRINS